MQETQVWFLGQEDPLEKEMTTHCNILAYRIPRTEVPGELQSMVSQRVRHDWVINTVIIKGKINIVKGKIKSGNEMYTDRRRSPPGTWVNVWCSSQISECPVERWGYPGSHSGMHRPRKRWWVLVAANHSVFISKEAHREECLPWGSW